MTCVKLNLGIGLVFFHGSKIARAGTGSRGWCGSERYVLSAVSLFDPFNLSALIPPPKVNKQNFVQKIEHQNSGATWVQVIQDALNPLVNETVFNSKGGYTILAFSAIYGETAIYSTCDQLT